MARTITEAQVRRIAQEEMFLRMLEEGIWDDVKAGAVKLRSLVGRKFGKVAQKWGQAIQDRLSKLQIPDDVNVAMQALKTGMKETGESITLDDNLKLAKELGSVTKEKALALAQEELEGPVHQLAASLQKQASPQAEARHYAKIYSVLIETPLNERQQLNEFGISGVVGVGLAVMGGLPMMFKGLEKLAHLLHANKLAHLFEKAEHVCHAFEVKTINKVMPDRLSYVVYKFLHNKGLRFKGEKDDHLLNLQEYVKDADGSNAMHRVNGLIYKAVLIYFAFNGLAGVLHAGASLVGVVEGAATTVKGVELARGAMEIAALTGKAV